VEDDGRLIRILEEDLIREVEDDRQDEDGGDNDSDSATCAQRLVLLGKRAIDVLE
jgi:hypothetical protein